MTAEAPELAAGEDDLTLPSTDDRLTYTFHGETLHLPERVGLMPLLRFAHAAQSGLDTADFEGMAAMYDMLRDCFDNEATVVNRADGLTVRTAGSWDRFIDLSTRHKSGEDELLQVVQDVIELLTARPTRRPSSSPGGRSSTGPSLTVISSSVERALELQSGRPDLQQVTLEVAEARAAPQTD